MESGHRRRLLTNKVNGIGRFTSRHTDQKIVGFDIAVDQRLIVDRLNTGNLKKESNGCNGMDYGGRERTREDNSWQGTEEAKKLPFALRPCKRS